MSSEDMCEMDILFKTLLVNLKLENLHQESLRRGTALLEDFKATKEDEIKINRILKETRIWMIEFIQIKYTLEKNKEEIKEMMVTNDYFTKMLK